jgi:aryl-alcohol dehydrogenase-like predicted oxidoreductase
MADVALAWLLARPEVTAVVVGAREPEQVWRNAAGVGLELDRATAEELDGITQPIKDKLGGNADMWVGKKESRIH